ncbi:plasmid transfer protein TraA [Kitasatospora sp. NPDC093679]|uniref:plasmid transfer protein TraA n=1 Tax=Kitasatospora sp. NPDC093679 TaxID=3154983 RepID=UPI00344761D3
MTDFLPPPRRNNDQSQGRADGGRTGRERPSREYHFHYKGGDGGGHEVPRRGPGAGGIGAGPRDHGAGGGGRTSGGRTHSPLADPEFFTNADIRNYCEQGRAAFLQLSFELAMAAEVLQAVLKEVPDADGRPFGSQFRARRVARHLKKAADDAKDAAANAARTYAAFQREYDPELNRTGRPRPPRRSFDFGG